MNKVVESRPVANAFKSFLINLASILGCRLGVASGVLPKVH